MIELLQNILSWLEVVARDITTTLFGVVSLLETLPTVILSYGSAISYLPVQIRLYALMVIAIAIIFLIIDR